MIKVYKYSVPWPPRSDEFFMEIPDGGRVISAQIQNGLPQMWALVDPDAPVKRRHFLIAGTGHNITHDIDSLDFIDTFQFEDGRLVIHLFEVK